MLCRVNESKSRIVKKKSLISGSAVDSCYYCRDKKWLNNSFQTFILCQQFIVSLLQHTYTDLSRLSKQLSFSTCSHVNSFYTEHDRFPVHLLGIRIPYASIQTLDYFTDSLNKCRSECEPAHSFAAQRSADSDFQGTAHLQCVNKRPIQSAMGPD